MLRAALRNQAALRAPATGRFAYQAARGLASKPPKNQKTATNPPPPREPPASSPAEEAAAEPPLQNKSSVPSLDFSPGEDGPRQERTGARSSKDSLSSIERRRRFLGRVSFAMMLAGAGAAAWYSGRDWEDDELKAKRMVRPPSSVCARGDEACRGADSMLDAGGGDAGTMGAYEGAVCGNFRCTSVRFCSCDPPLTEASPSQDVHGATVGRAASSTPTRPHAPGLHAFSVCR